LGYNIPMQKKQLVIFGILGSIGMFFGIIADLATGYLASFNRPLTGDILTNVYIMISYKPLWQMVLGHYLSIFGLSLGLFGLWQVYRAVRPASERLSFLALILGVFAYICGIVFHTQFAYYTVSNQIFIRPVAGLFLISMMTVIVIIFFLIASGKTLYPRWINWFNPLVTIPLFWLAALLSPPKLQILLLFIVYNAALFIFYAAATYSIIKTGGK